MLETGVPVGINPLKQPVGGRVALRTLNLNGDGRADLTVHGGEYIRPSTATRVHCDYWRRQLPGQELPAGVFGENFTTDGCWKTRSILATSYLSGPRKYS